MSISTETAFNIRFTRGLNLPAGIYEDARVMKIAKRQHELFLQIWDLDDQLRNIYWETKNDDSRKSE